jgi:SAM-dependent methyltransferase
MKSNSDMDFNRDFLRRYIEIAPAALAIERSLECEILAAQPFKRPILDIGCGDGIFATILSPDRIDTGIDYDPAEIARAKIHDRYHELIACGAHAIPKPDGSYRKIFSNSVLEHIPDLLPVLVEQHRLLAPGGNFYVTIPTDRWERASLLARSLHALGLHELAKSYARFYNSFWRHYHAYGEAQWTALFEQAGFKVTQYRCYAPPNLTTLLDVLTVPAAPAMVSKKILGRWIAIPALRQSLAPLIFRLLAGPVSTCQRQSGGNLMFLALTKKVDNA